MTFLEKFEEIKKISDVDVKFDKDFAIQINLTDEDCGGAFYVEHRSGVVNVEPYDYNDRDAMMTIGSDLLVKTLTGEVDSVAAFFAGKFTIDGNVEAVLELTKIADAVKAKKKAEEKAAKEAKKAKEKAKAEAEKKAKAEAEKKAKAEAEKKAKAEAEKKAA
ncbi:MAG: SCP2 sterol-binding domain-containing protein, partial [Clostridia bacterium]|nr:SCP2 sterol-binding domain-containing protein [Clostridia bacterium]